MHYGLVNDANVVAAAVRGRRSRPRGGQAAGWRAREQDKLRRRVGSDSDVKGAGFGAAEGNDRSSGW